MLAVLPGMDQCFLSACVAVLVLEDARIAEHGCPYGSTTGSEFSPCHATLFLIVTIHIDSWNLKVALLVGCLKFLGRQMFDKIPRGFSRGCPTDFAFCKCGLSARLPFCAAKSNSLENSCLPLIYLSQAVEWKTHLNKPCAVPSWGRYCRVWGVLGGFDGRVMRARVHITTHYAVFLLVSKFVPWRCRLESFLVL